MPAALNIVGRTFGSLFVLAEAPPVLRYGKPIRRSYVRCHCGRELTVLNSNLYTGATASCGCSHTKHGHGRAHSGTYQSWAAMIQRCTNSNCQVWKHYGGRGITVCDRWRNSFEAFLRDMGERPAHLTLERLDNSKGYSPDNCAWRTRREQSRNQRSNRVFTVAGVTACLTELAERFGVNRDTVKRRLQRGWLVEDAFTRKVS